MKNKFEDKKEEIENLGLEAIRDFFKVNPEELSKETIDLLHSKAKIGMSFERELNVGKRAIENNYLRVFRMIASDKDELKKYIKKSMPKKYSFI